MLYRSPLKMYNSLTFSIFSTVRNMCNNHHSWNAPHIPVGLQKDHTLYLSSALPTPLATTNLLSSLWICCFRHPINRIIQYVTNHPASCTRHVLKPIPFVVHIDTSFPVLAQHSPVWIYQFIHCQLTGIWAPSSPAWIRLIVSSLVSLHSILLHLLSPQQPEGAH